VFFSNERSQVIDSGVQQQIRQEVVRVLVWPTTLVLFLAWASVLALMDMQLGRLAAPLFATPLVALIWWFYLRNNSSQASNMLLLS